MSKSDERKKKKMKKMKKKKKGDKRERQERERERQTTTKMTKMLSSHLTASPAGRCTLTPPDSQAVPPISSSIHP